MIKYYSKNINGYFSHKGMSPHLIDDIKEKYRQDIKKSEEKIKITLNIEVNHLQLILTIQ